jgi:hypothetical protein
MPRAPRQYEWFPLPAGVTALLADLMTGLPASPCTGSVGSSLQGTGNPEARGNFSFASAEDATVSTNSSAASAVKPVRWGSSVES